MAPPALVRALLSATVLSLLLAPVADGVEAVPDEGATMLAGPTFGAIVGDVDADGVRELVRLVPWGVNPGQLAVEVVTVRDGALLAHGRQVVRRAATPDDTFAGRNPDEENLLPVATREPTLLIAVQRGGEERVLAASIGTIGLNRPCCLTLWEVGLSAADATQLRFIQDTVTSAAWVVAADLDADGTDELVVAETPDPARPEGARIVVLRWHGAAFDRLSGGDEDGLIAGPLVGLGDSDGLPGEEAGFVGLPGRFDGSGPLLHRIGLAPSGEVVTERATLPFEGEVVGIGAQTGRLALVSGSGLEVFAWPAGAGEAESVAQSVRGGRLLGALGEGRAARLLVERPVGLEILDGGLLPVAEVAPAPAAARFVNAPRQPYVGMLPGGDRAGRPAFVFAGWLVAASTAQVGVSVREMATLPGTAPIGLFGPDRAWAAVGDNPTLPVVRGGGALVFGARADRVAVVPADVLLRPPADGGLLEAALSGAVRADERADGGLLLAADAVQARVTTPPGSRVEVVRDGELADWLIVGAPGTATMDLVEPDPEAAEDERLTVRLLVTTPGGHGYVASWDVRVLRRPPALSVESSLASLGFSAVVAGRTDRLARVEVDGRSVPVGEDGSFRIEVGAGLLPRSVPVRALDPVGNVSELTVSVVAPLDYRRLPWVPIVAALTLLAGVVLYLRAPRPRSSEGRRGIDQGTLEDLD